jgi:hypothetical protein
MFLKLQNSKSESRFSKFKDFKDFKDFLNFVLSFNLKNPDFKHYLYNKAFLKLNLFSYKYGFKRSLRNLFKNLFIALIQHWQIALL